MGRAANLRSPRRAQSQSRGAQEPKVFAQLVPKFCLKVLRALAGRV